jgi:glutaredoxin
MLLNDDFTIYGKTSCPYCDLAKALLDKQGITYRYVDVVEQNLVDWLKDQGLRTVPQVWYNDSRIGGYTELKEFVLDKMLNS